MTAVIQYISTSAQSFGSQDYYNKSLITILGLAGVLFCENEQTTQNGLLFVTKKILTWVPREARRGLKVIAGKSLTTLLSFYPHICLLLSVSFSQSFVFPTRL